MTIFRRLLSLTMALSLIFSFGLTALAADYEASDFDQLKYAFSAAENAEGDTAVNVTITDSIDFGFSSLETQENYTYTIGNNGADHALQNAKFTGPGTVEINTDIVSSRPGYAALYVQEGVTVTVNGNISAQGDVSGGVTVHENCNLTVTGNINTEGKNTTGLLVLGGSVTVTGNVTAVGESSIGISAQSVSVISVSGDVTAGSGNPDNVDFSDPSGYSDGGTGIAATNAVVTVGGNVTGGNGYGTCGYGGTGIDAAGSAKVFVGGDVTGGNVYANPETPANGTEVSEAGNAIWMSSTATVQVAGNASGGSTNAANGIAGSGLNMEFIDGTQGSATVEGSVTGGTGDNNSNIGILLDNSEQVPDSQILETEINVGSYTGLKSENIEPDTLNQLVPTTEFAVEESQEDLFWSGVTHQLRNAREGDTVTIDAGFRTHIPTHILKTAQELGLTLIIRWNGGDDITVDASTTYDETHYSIPLADLV